MTTLHRHIAIGETISFDGGRIVVTLQEKTGRRAALRLQLADDVRVDKPSDSWVMGGVIRTPLANAKA